MRNGDWYYSPEHRQLCRVIEEQALWGETVCRVWLPGSDTVVRLPAACLRPVHEAGVGSVEWIVYMAAAARLADALTKDVLLAPIESAVIPLPHQIRALSRAISNNQVRYLLADEVGLGKTIEAGLIMRELKLRGLVKRTLVVAPKGLVTQWVAEMDTHFGEEFRLLIPGDISAYRRIAREDNVWQSHPQVVCPVDSVKPIDKRRGWSAERVAEYNRERFENLIAAGWDLVIVDEAHRLGGSTDQVARYKLGQGLAEAAPYLLLLSATPHQGKSDQFRRLMSLLDPQGFPDEESITRERVKPFVIRTEKRRALDAQGKPLFKPRRTELVPVSWKERHREQRLLYEAVTEYVREGYNQAVLDKQNYVGFLMILMQRLVVSSTRAIRTTLERRLEALESPPEGLLPLSGLETEEWYEMDSEEQLLAMIQTRLQGIRNEREEVRMLLKAAERCEHQNPDVKAEALLDWIYRLQAEENNPELKVLVFTEFVPTQEMLYGFLTERGFKVVCLNGSMSMEERKVAQDEFAGDARILISTEAGGEGLNLQFCHIVINYDIPWNPMRLEQRIGRVDRIGQSHPVRAINFVFEDSVEYRVQEVLEEKLALIFKEFGVDKSGDVLDSAQAGQIFDDLYVKAILHPENVEGKVDEVLKDIEDQIRSSRQCASLLGSDEALPPLGDWQQWPHQLPYWVEQMTVNFILAHGGKAVQKQGSWNLTWPDGETMTKVVFTQRKAEYIPMSYNLSLENPRVRSLLKFLPSFVPGQQIPVVRLSGLSSEITGFWSLWRISLNAMDKEMSYRIMALFLSDEGKVLIPSSRHIWDQLLTADSTILRYLDASSSQQALERLWEIAVQRGKIHYDELLQAHQSHIARVREKGAYAFAARRKAIDRIGLPTVRKHHMRRLEHEEILFLEDVNRKNQVFPEFAPLVIIRVDK